MRIALIYLLLLSVLFGCKIGKNYKGTELEVPEIYKSEDPLVQNELDTLNTDSLNFTTPDLLWSEIFNDTTLDSLTQLALENNKNLLIAAENVAQARYILNIQRSNLLPAFNASAAANRTNALFNISGDPFTVVNAQASFNWEIDIWGKLRRQNEAARAELLSTEYAYRGIMISLITELADAYFELLKLKAQLKISEQNAFSRDSMLQIIQTRFDEGIVPIIDVNQAKIQYTIAAGTTPQIKRAVVQVENAIQFLIGEYPDSIPTSQNLSEVEILNPVPLGVPSDLLANRPDVIAAEAQLMAQNARVGAAQANRLPSLGLSGLLGISGSSLDQMSIADPIWGLGGQFLAPLFYWGQLKRQVDIEKSRRNQSLLNYENTILQASREVEDVLIDIKTTEDEYKIAEMRKNAAVQAQTLSRERYVRGVTSYLEFLEQQRQAFDAELLLADLKARLLSNQIRLYRALGGGWISKAERGN